MDNGGAEDGPKGIFGSQDMATVRAQYPAVSEALANKSLDCISGTALQWVADIRGSAQLPALPGMDPINDDAPRQENCFLDGSARYTRSDTFSYSSAGVFHVSRRRHDDPLTDAERLCLAEADQLADGLAQYISLEGLVASSNRSEAAGLLAALQAPRALRIWVDNLNAVRNAHLTQSGLAGTYRKPWGLPPNGDIWQCIEATLHDHGRRGTQIVKVKGHATEEHLRSGVANEHQRWGNQVADKMADDAHDFHPLLLRQYVALTTERRKEYATLVDTIQHILYSGWRSSRRPIQGLCEGSARSWRAIGQRGPTAAQTLPTPRLRRSLPHNETGRHG